MSTLAWIVLVSIAGGALSVLAAGAFALSARAAWVPHLISYAIGALLGVAFLDMLPEAIEAQGNPEMTTGVVLLGILGFFVMEKLVLWRHYHAEEADGHHHGEHGRSGLLILVGDTFHNFVDGVLIAAAFMESVPLGMVTALAMIAHEIPQEVGDFIILLHSGYSRAKALAFNLLSSVATLLGGLLAYATLSAAEGLVPFFLAVAAASMIYVAVADLIPGLHKRRSIQATLQQVVLIGLGIGTIVLAHRLVDGVAH